MPRVITAAALVAISVYGHQNDRSLASKTYCPPKKTGLVPTENCQAYVECVEGVQGNNRFNCPPGTIFDVVADTCNWPNSVLDCSPFIAYADGQATDDVDESNTINYCPAEYTGRAPTSGCSGYVNCVYGEPTSVANCQTSTTFDSETLMCVSGKTECKLLVDLTGGMSDEMIQMNAEAERIVFPRDCSGKFTGKAAINECTGYIECDDGVELARYNCTQGTLFDRDIGLCNWKSQVTCASSSPSMKPTQAPTTASPTPWDPNNVYYPRWDKGVCVNDGKQPEGVDRSKYLFSDIEVCCEKWFPDNAECLKSSPPPTKAPVIDLRPKIWYPDYLNNLCKKDDKHGPYEQNFFSSYEKCCQFGFMNEAKCLENKPATYYANYDTNTCTSDGSPSLYEDKMFMTHQQCCEYEWIDTEACVSADDVGSTVDDALVQNSASVGLWYPDTNSKRCKNDGKSPDGVLVYTSYQVCCHRKMPSIKKECEYNSQASMAS